MPKPKPIQISIPNPCHQSWDEMTPQGQGRHCAHCQKVVTDFTGWSDTALYEFLIKNKDVKICGRFRAEQVNRNIIPHQPHSRLYTLFIGLSLTLVLAQLPTQQAFAQAPVIQEQAQLQSVSDKNNTGPVPTDTVFVRGVVLDEKNEPVIGAIVQILNNSKVIGGVATDVDGLFNVAINGNSGNDLKTAVLKVLYTSYQTKEISLQKIDISKNIKIELELNVKGMLSGLISPQYKIPLIDEWERPNTTITSEQIEKMPR